jgi:predicted ribonuclease YlaK
MPDFGLNSLLNREWKTWDARLSQVIDELRKADVFTKHPGRIVVPDTSALMEGILFTEYDRHALYASLASGPVRIIVPVLVVEELDGHMHSRDRHRKTAAKEVLRPLWALHRKAPTEPAPLPQAADVTIEVFTDSDFHKRRENNDGEIIDQALSIQELTGQPVTLATCDYNQAYRAAVPSLTTALMPRRDEQEHPESLAR